MCISEALCLGLPVAAYSVGGIGEMLSTPGAGVAVSRSDVDALAAAVTRLLNQTDGLTEESRVVARRYYDPSRVAAATAEMYRRIVSEETRC
jgi:glycosyltransferase involved in cell wall biosynthesis